METLNIMSLYMYISHENGLSGSRPTLLWGHSDRGMLTFWGGQCEAALLVSFWIPSLSWAQGSITPVEILFQMQCGASRQPSLTGFVIMWEKSPNEGFKNRRKCWKIEKTLSITFMSYHDCVWNSMWCPWPIGSEVWGFKFRNFHII